MFSNSGSTNTFTSRVVLWGQKVDAAWPWKTQTQTSSSKPACNLTLLLDMLMRTDSTWSKLGWRSWRCVRFRYSSSLHSNCVEKLKSWLCCGPLLHWRRKTCGWRALITMNSCSWGNFLSGRKGRSCRDGTAEERALWNTRLFHWEYKMKWEARLVLPCTCAQLSQVVAEVNVQLSDLERDPDRRDKPRGKAGVHTGARRQGFGRHQLITGQLGTTVAVRTRGEATPVCVYTFAIMMKKVSWVSYESRVVSRTIEMANLEKMSIGYQLTSKPGF